MKKLTITVTDEVYEGLHRRIGARRISACMDQIRTLPKARLTGLAGTTS